MLARRAEDGGVVEVLVAGGCEIALTGSPATTDDATAALLATLDGVTVFAANADDASVHAAHLARVVAFGPDLLLDNGAELIAAAAERALGVTAATEETTSGANRLRAELHGRVPFPVVVIDDSPLKRLIENTYGVGPTVVEGFMRATNLLVAATASGVVGYGGAAAASHGRCVRTGPPSSSSSAIQCARSRPRSTG